MAGSGVFASTFPAPVRPSAARAALRGTSPLPHLLQRAEPVRPWLPALVHVVRRAGRHQYPSRNPVMPTRLKTMASQAWPRCNKCGSGLVPRSAARAALGLTGAESVTANTREAPRGRRSVAPHPPTFRNTFQRSSPSHAPMFPEPLCEETIWSVLNPISCAVAASLCPVACFC